MPQLAISYGRGSARAKRLNGYRQNTRIRPNVITYHHSDATEDKLELEHWQN